MGIEPTGAEFPRLPTDLKSAQDTSPDALPFPDVAALYRNRVPVPRKRVAPDPVNTRPAIGCEPTTGGN